MDELHYGAWVLQPVAPTSSPPLTLLPPPPPPPPPPPSAIQLTPSKHVKKAAECLNNHNSNDNNNNNNNNNNCDMGGAHGGAYDGDIVFPRGGKNIKPIPEPTSMGLDSEEEEEEEEEDEEEEEKKGLSDDSSDSLSTTTSCERAPLLFIDEANGEDDEMEFVDGDSKIVENKEKLVEEEVKTPTTVNLPLIDYLCAYNNSCSLKELLALFQCVPARRRMLSQLQQHCNLRTAHLRPAQRNVALHAHDFSVHNVDKTFACGGYLSLTVRQYFYAKHNIRLKHAQLPTLIEFGGGTHASYYPLECVHVVLNDGGGSGVQNSTATFSLHLLSTVRFTTDQFLALARNASCTEYNPSRFHAIVMRVRQRSVTSNNNNNDKRISDYGRTATALIFRSGRVVLTGVACSPYTLIQEACVCQARRVCRRVCAALKRSGHHGVGSTLGVRHLTLCNLVSTVRVAHRIDIEQLANYLSTCGGCESMMSIRRVRRVCFDLCTFPGLRCSFELSSPHVDDGGAEAGHWSQHMLQHVYFSSPDA
ncbi:hypothetical protein GPALN_004925 [Globodera pallida]|nr:hypothetical protein GPALN_004925 [Globodera pallida]